MPAATKTLTDTTFLEGKAAQLRIDSVIRQGDHRVEGSGDSEALVDMRRILAQRDPLYRKADAHLDTERQDLAPVT